MSEGNVIRFCVSCGSAVQWLIPAGDHFPRHVCMSCGHIHYLNPRVVVGCVPQWRDGRILMCRRGIAPREGFWTFPSGFLEYGETGAEGACREAWEEARAEVEIGGLLCLLDVPQINEVHLVYHGRLVSGRFAPTPESPEVRLMAEEETPWQQLAFASIGASLRHFFADRSRAMSATHLVNLVDEHS